MNRSVTEQTVTNAKLFSVLPLLRTRIGAGGHTRLLKKLQTLNPPILQPNGGNIGGF